MESYNKVIRPYNIKGSTIKAYLAGNGVALSFSNPNNITDGDSITSGGILSGIGTFSNFYIDIIFPSFIEKIIRLEYITSIPNEIYEEGETYIQYLPSTSTITPDTPPADFDDFTTGPGSKEDFITIDDNPFPYISLSGYPSFYRALVTELSTPINTQRIRYRFTDRDTATHIINEFKVYTMQGEFNFEFNDSVLETKAWNSSRYNGKQLQGTKINKFTSGDVSYGKTPVVGNYTRNIYLGSRIVGMNSGSVDDGSLTQFEGFSYVTMHEYITINEDLSITRYSIKGDAEGSDIKKKGFYQSFYQDFPIGSNVEVKIFDETIGQNLKSSYKIFNNSGQLQQLLTVERHPTEDTGSGYGVSYSGSNQLFYATSSNQNDLGAKFTIYNQQLLIDDFFTGSLISTPPAWDGGSNSPAEPEL